LSTAPDSFEALAHRLARAAIEELAPDLERRGLPLHPEWLSPEQASVYTGFAVKSLEQMRRHGEGSRYSKVGPRIRYRRTDLDAWLASYAVEVPK
jgi:hypothetical protein